MRAIDVAPVRALIFSTTLAACAVACRGSETPTRSADAAASSADLDVAYGVDAARPRTSFDLHIPSVGEAELYLGASPEGADTVGYFRAPVAPETRAALSRLVSAGGLLSRSGGPSATAEGSGFLRLASGAQKADVPLTSSDEALTALRSKLDEIVVEVARHPLRALRMNLTATREGATWRPEITLTQVGTEPLPVLFFDPEDEAFWLRAAVTAGPRAPTSQLARTNVAALVQSNVLPGGVTTAPAGAVYHLPLAPLAGSPDGGAVELSGAVTFWLPGAGASRRAVELRARVTAR